MSFYIRVPFLITPFHCITQTEEPEVIVVDVSEQEIERPKKKQKSCYSGKQGYHTLKSQVVADQKSEQVICVRCEKGRVHDFRLWKMLVMWMMSKLPLKRVIFMLDGLLLILLVILKVGQGQEDGKS
jgi:hypothetical protein